MELLGLTQLDASLKKFIKDQEKRVADTRRKVMHTLVQELMVNIPVWSGRTLESIRVNNTGATAPLQGDPQPPFAFDEAAIRAAAVSDALAQVSSADYHPSKRVYLTVYSEAWGLVEMAKAPNPQEARNTAVVSEIAMARTRAAHPSVR